jgi:hypothetical protein
MASVLCKFCGTSFSSNKHLSRHLKSFGDEERGCSKAMTAAECKLLCPSSKGPCHVRCVQCKRDLSKWSILRPVAPSPRHLVAPSPCRPVAPSPRRPVAPSPRRPVAPSPRCQSVRLLHACLDKPFPVDELGHQTCPVKTVPL